MNENVGPALLADEAVTFTIIEPLNSSLKSCHLLPP